MQSPSSPGAVPVLLVTGVSGSGKTTVGSLLAGRLGWAYAEADAFHPSANLAKMSAGHPLDDADRAPWLAAIGAFIDETTAAGRPAVVTCSALKRAYRETLRRGRDNVRLVFLDAGYPVVRDRLGSREGHFFPAELLASQYRDLEPPGPDEGAVTVSADASPEQIVERIIELGVAA
jgi:gluconokinase